MNQGLVKAINEHKAKVSGPHFLFSAEDPHHAREITGTHEDVLKHLKDAGYDAHTVNQGHKARSIIVYGIDANQAEHLHKLASRLGQDSSMHSDGNVHDLRHHSKEKKGQSVKGQGTTWHDKKPEGYCTSLPGGLHHFTHNLDDVKKSEPYFSYLIKSADDDAYKKIAHSGMALMHPVSINGQRKNPHNGVDYHTTIKVFDKTKDSPDQAHAIASETPLRPPHPKHVGINPITLPGQGGYTVHALELTGHHVPEAKANNARFEGMGYKTSYDYKPHISVDKETWDDIKAKGHKTAHDAGIKFHDAELRQGDETLARYHHKDQLATTAGIQSVREKANSNPTPLRNTKLGKSELLEKGLMRNFAAGAAMASTLASCALAPHDHTSNVDPHTIERSNVVDKYDHQKMLNAIATVESSGGKNLNHKPTSSGTAYGKYALMPETVRETIRLNQDLHAHKGALALDNDGVNGYLGKHPGLEDQLADHHLKRLEQHFGQNRDQIGFAWNQGITGTSKAIKEKKDYSNHPYVEKLRDAYRSKS